MSLASIQALGAGDALSMQFAGNVEATVTVSWSDVVTAAVPALSRVLRSQQAIALKVKAGASVSATVSLSDEFMVVFSRADATNIRVALKKARASSVGLSLHAGVSVEFADPQAVADAATSLAEGVFGEPGAKIDALLQQADLSSLSGAQKKVADALLARLGLSPSATAAALKEKIDEVRAKAHEAIVEAARRRLPSGSPTSTGECRSR